MPKYQIQVKAVISNITDILPSSEFEYKFKLKCSDCREENESESTFAANDQVELLQGRSYSNFVMKCKFCSKVGSLDIVPKTQNALKKDVQEWQNFVVVEGRGWEPVKYIPGDGFMGNGNTGSRFEIELNELEWTDYDEDAHESVEIMEVETKIIKFKQ